MRNRRYKTIDRIRFYRKGFSLIDTVAGMLILFIIVMGSLSYRYVSAANIQKSQQQLSAADLTTTFLETWQGVGGSDTFDPETTFASVLTISNGNGENAPNGYTLLGKYSVMEENIPYEVTLSWSDVVMYVDGDLYNPKSNTGINVNDNSSLSLYITGDFGPGENGVDLSSSSGDPSALKVYGVGTSAQEFVLGKNKASCVGFIYAPKADITIGKNKATFTGQITANSFYSNNSANLEFDARAAGVNPIRGGLTIKEWYE